MGTRRQEASNVGHFEYECRTDDADDKLRIIQRSKEYSYFLLMSVNYVK